MNTAILNIELFIAAPADKILIPLLPEEIIPLIPPITPGQKRFGIADLWKIHNTKRHFSIYSSRML